jgi:hydroxypyruvate isomerase
VPSRHEPDEGELNHRHLFALIDEIAAEAGLGDSWVGCEYHPKRGAKPGGTSEGLGWLHALDASASTLRA